MNTGIPGLNPLRDPTYKAPTEQAIIVHEERYWQAQWTKFCRKLWRQGKTAACDVHKQRDFVEPKPNLSLIGKAVVRGAVLLIAWVGFIWWYLEGRYVDLTWLIAVPSVAFLTALAFVIFMVKPKP